MEEYDEILIRKPMRTKDEIKPGSHYNDHEPNNKRKFKYGNSRDAGDAPLDVQRQVIRALVAEGKKAGLTDHEIALVVSIVRYESGFNPDAANKSTSAAGLGQFDNDSRGQYNVTQVFDITENVRAVVQYYKACKAKAISYGHGGSQERSGQVDLWFLS